MKLRALWAELEEGKTLTRIAREHDITRKTLRKKLRDDKEEKYNKIMKTGRTAEKTIDLRASWAELAKEMPLTRIAQG
jgi:transposase-like protein